MIPDSAIHGSCVVIMVPRASIVSLAPFRRKGVKKEILSTNRLLILTSISSHFFSNLLILELNGSTGFIIASRSPESLSRLRRAVWAQGEIGSLDSVGAVGGQGGLAKCRAARGARGQGSRESRGWPKGESRVFSIGRGSRLPRVGPRELSGVGGVAGGGE